MSICFPVAGCSTWVAGDAHRTTLPDRLATSFQRAWAKRPRLPRPPASNERPWRADLAVLPYAAIEENQITIFNIRNARYRTENDVDVRHYDLSFRLEDIRRVDFVIVPFQESPLLAHTMVSFALANGQHFVVSVEARFEQGENYSLRGGAGSEYELIYVIGDERDLIPLRTEVRQVEVFIFPGRATPDQAQRLLVDMLERANQLAEHPEYYDLISNNCTTNLVDHVNRLTPNRIPRDWRVLLPGRSDRLAFELGLLDISTSFEKARALARVNPYVPLHKNDPDFSRLIRQHLHY